MSLGSQSKKWCCTFHVVEHEQECFSVLRKLVSFIPLNNLENLPRVSSDDDPARQDEELNSILPINTNKAYDMGHAIECRINTDHPLTFVPFAGTVKN